MDLIVRADRFVSPGETIIGLDYHTASGGKGANQAVQAAIGNVQIQENENGTHNRIMVVPGANMRLTVQDVAFLKHTIAA